MIFSLPTTWNEFLQAWQGHHLYDPNFYTMVMMGLAILMFLIGFLNRGLVALFKKYDRKYPDFLDLMMTMLTLATWVAAVAVVVFGIFAKNNHQIQVRNEKAKAELVVIASQRKAIQQQLENQQTKRLELVHKNASKYKLQQITDEIITSKHDLEVNANQRQAIIAKQIRGSY